MYDWGFRAASPLKRQRHIGRCGAHGKETPNTTADKVPSTMCRYVGVRGWVCVYPCQHTKRVQAGKHTQGQTRRVGSKVGMARHLPISSVEYHIPPTLSTCRHCGYRPTVSAAPRKREHVHVHPSISFIHIKLAGHHRHAYQVDHPVRRRTRPWPAHGQHTRHDDVHAATCTHAAPEHQEKQNPRHPPNLLQTHCAVFEQ